VVWVLRRILAHISFVEQLLTKSFLGFFYLYSVLGIVDEGYGRILTFFDQDLLTSLVLADNDFVKYFWYFFHPFLPEGILFGLVAASVVLYHIL
jgi:hypothetical protein